MLTKIKNALRQPGNRQIIVIVVLLFIIINVIAWFSLRPYMKQPPCYVCGRVKTRPVKTLYQYRVEVLPYMKSVDIWYCDRHYQHAADIVTKLPIKNDSVAGRFRIAIIAGAFSLFSVLFIIILLEMSFHWLYIHPGLIAITYISAGMTSNLTVVVLLISTFALAIGIFYFWSRWLNK